MSYAEAQTVTASEKEVTKHMMGAHRQHHASVVAAGEIRLGAECGGRPQWRG